MSQKKSNIPIVATLEHSGAVRSVAFHPTANLMATAGDDNVVKLWDTNTHQHIADLVGHTGVVTCVAFHPTEPVLISGSEDKTLKVWDTTTHQCLSTTTPPAHQHGVTCIAIHPTMSFIVTGGRIDPPKLWKLSPSSLLMLVEVMNGRILNSQTISTRCIAVHPTNPFFVTGREYSRYDSSVLLWSDDCVEIEYRDEKHTRGISSIALHPTKPYIATGSDDKTIRLWQQIRSEGRKKWHYECFSIIDGHDAAVTGLAFHPTAQVLLSCSADESVKMWKLPDNRERVECMGTLLGQRGPVTCLALHPNGRVFATGNERNAALLWDCSVLNIRRQREMAVMRSGMTMKLQDNFFGMNVRTPHTQEGLDHKSNQRGPNLLTPQEMAASLITRRINSRRYRPAIVAPAPVRTISPIAPPPPYARARRGRSASPPRGRPLSYTRSRRRGRSASPSYTRLGGSSTIHRIKKHSSRKVKRHASKTRRYRKFIR